MASHTLRRQVYTLPHASSRFFATVSGRRGAPPISIEDLYGLVFLQEPSVKTKDREPEDMLNTDLKLNEVVIYLNGGYFAPADQVNEQFTFHMRFSKVIFFMRDAGERPELRKLLKERGGTDELPQLWVQGKMVGSGQELANAEKVFELCTPARRPWPRKSRIYQEGFYGYANKTVSAELH
jgi:glutaredoxin-related protein